MNTVTSTTIPDIVRRSEFPEIWAAHADTVSKCYSNPTRWHYRPDCDLLQFLGASDKVRKIPYGVEEIVRLTAERIELEKKVQESAQKLCAEWGGLILLSPQEVHADKHCVKEYHLVAREVEPNYAMIIPVNGGYSLAGALWGPELQVQVSTGKIRRDNGPGVSEITGEFTLPSGHIIKSWRCGGGFASLNWKYRVIDGKIPAAPYPRSPFTDGQAHECGSGYSESQSETKMVLMQLRVNLYKRIQGFEPKD